MQEAFREKEKAVLSFQVVENNEVKLRSNLYELEMKYEKATEQYKRDLEQRDTKHNLEIVELNKAIHGTLSFQIWMRPLINCTRHLNSLKIRIGPRTFKNWAPNKQITPSRKRIDDGQRRITQERNRSQQSGSECQNWDREQISRNN